MRIKCLHGYFKFQELNPSELSRFIKLTRLTLAPKDDYFTFPLLKNAPNYSLEGGTYLGATATKTFEGTPWEVMRENGLVYDFVKNKVVAINTVISPILLKQSTNYFLSNGMILPGSLTDRGDRVKDYSAFYLFDTYRFKYTEVIV